MDKRKETGPNKEAQGDDDDYMPNISLDRYMSSRRRHKANWIHLTSILLMLAAVVAVFLFKDQCGQSVSNTIFMQAPRENREPIRVKMPPSKAQSKPPAKDEKNNTVP